MIGADGREYGPVAAETIRNWIRQRRANGRTQLRPVDESQWRSLDQFEEFTDRTSEPAGISGGFTPPSFDRPDVDGRAQEIIDRGYNLDIFALVRRAWELYQKNFVGMTLTTAIVLIVLNGLQTIAGAGQVAAIIISGPMFGGLALYFLRLIRGESADVGDVFTGFKNAVLPLILGGVVISVLISAGLILCVLPGIYLFVGWMFAIPLIMDKRIDFWPAMELSRKVVHDRWWEVFGLAIIWWVLLILGAFVFGIGIFFTAPIAMGALFYAYEDIFNPPVLTSTKAPDDTDDASPETGEEVKSD